MDTNLLLIVLIVLVLLVGGVLLLARRRSERLRSRFGPEYERELEAAGSRRKAEAELAEREKRVEKLPLRPLPDSERARFSDAWRKVQAEFVDDPAGSMAHADSLIGEVMAARGYPMSNFEQTAADISVDHPSVVQNYRAGHAIAMRHRDGQAGTEDLRQAMIHYRELFAELVTDDEAIRRKSGDAR